MQLSPHTTKKGPGRRHMEETYRNGKNHLAKRKHSPGFGYPGAKLARKAFFKTITVRG